VAVACGKGSPGRFGSVLESAVVVEASTPSSLSSPATASTGDRKRRRAKDSRKGKGKGSKAAKEKGSRAGKDAVLPTTSPQGPAPEDTGGGA
jgi:hypothetical protein